MKYYFQLQFKILYRKLTALGIPPIIGFIIGGIAFYYLSQTLFDYHEKANYIYAALGLSFILKLNNYPKSNFIKAHFSRINYCILHFIEKLIVAFPFITFLVYKREFELGLVLFLSAVLLTFLSYRSNHNIYIPTPFSKKPFEFSVGFRKTFFVFPLCYALSIISVQVDNVNLGVFALNYNLYDNN